MTLKDDSRASWDRRARAETAASWEVYEKLILDKLDNHGSSLESIYKTLVDIQIEMGIVKTKLALIGALSGGVSSIAISIIVHFVKAG